MKLKKFEEPIKYIFVGVICQLTDFLITITFYNFSSNLFISNTFGYVLASFLSYIGHSKFTFRNRSKKLYSKKRISFFVLACISGIISGYLLLKILLIFRVNLLFAKFSQLAMIAIVQYVINSKLTFKKKKISHL